MPDNLDDLERQKLVPPEKEAGFSGGADPWVIKPLEELISRLNFALSSHSLYPVGHPVVGEALGKIYQILQPLLQTYPLITLQFHEEEVLYHGEFLLESSFLSRQLNALFKERAVGSITFYKDLKEEEVSSLIQSFHEGGRGEKSDLESLSRKLEEKNVAHIRLGRLEKANIKKGGSRFDEAKTVYTTGTQLVESVAMDAVSQRVVDVRQVRPVVQDLIDSLMEDKSALLAVSSLKSYDNYLFSHSMNVCILSLSLAIYLNIDTSRLMDIGTGALLHDIGKVFIPPEIIHKPGKLTASEWEIMRRHPVDGAKMILRSRYTTELPGLIIYCHHWKFALEDGYPQTRRKFQRIPYVSLVSVCDCYDAMTTNRPYNRVHLPADALGIINRNAGTALDPNIVYFFQKMIGQYPVGTLVKLSSGHVGIVLQANADDADHPNVKLILDPQGQILPDIDIIDLAEKDQSSNQYVNSIVEIVDPASVTFNIWEYL